MSICISTKLCSNNQKEFLFMGNSLNQWIWRIVFKNFNPGDKNNQKKSLKISKGQQKRTREVIKKKFKIIPYFLSFYDQEEKYWLYILLKIHD